MSGKSLNRPLFYGPMNDCGHDAQGNAQPLYRIITSASVVQPPAEPDTAKASDLMGFFLHFTLAFLAVFTESLL